ncbi:hypothetical protein IUY40_16280 [Flavobacterium sp. ALJ2]|uniref:hypothetical protein n=1 Tax=Flavobacterium sp. ALJ2 TaxID=2786960 RepID=UPI00189EA5C8|nr:hypothetical protein [Flavobacterium sp. ALJ2]MBF7093091.1 hypothetical protein [Flavobacterium sp. ALJ2]
MKDAIITWNKTYFDGENRLLPISNQLYCNFYDDNLGGWTIDLRFDEPPRIQGYKSKGKVGFMMDNAPSHILKKGYVFDVFHGPHKVGICEIISISSISIMNILDRVESLEIEKQDFKMYVSSIRDDSFDYSDDELKKLIKYSSDYPYLFSLVLKLNKEIALEYLKQYYLKYPIKNNAVYHSSLSLFLFNIDKYLGRENFNKFIKELPKNVNEDEIIKSAIEEILL